MKTTRNIQTGTIAPAIALQINPAAVILTLSRIIGENKAEYTGEVHSRYVDALTGDLKDENGEKPTFTPAQIDRLRVVYRPTESNLRNLRTQTLAEAGYALEPETEKVFDLVLNAAQFADFLSKTVNPKTKEPFIAKSKKRGVKKGKFNEVILAAAEFSEAATPTVESEITDGDEEKSDADAAGDEPEVTETTVAPALAKPAAVKPATRK